MKKLKYYFKEIKANAKVFYDKEARKKECLMPFVFITIAVITPFTIFSFAFNYEAAFRACCIFWALVLCYILEILFRNL